MDSEKIIVCCPYCGCEECVAQEKTFSNGTVHIAALCKSCGKHIKYLPQGKTPQEIAVQIMPIGKYKGKTFFEIVSQDADYAVWCSEKLSNENLRRKFKTLLQT